ncbi:hypothetical protein DFH28DRAFT_922960 [Melampsora americana]|nr:hypothetical protein DFH28DRAFT_922960 [Melampsora americana]
MLRQSLILFVTVLCLLPRQSEAYTAWGFPNCHTDCSVKSSDCSQAYNQFISNGVYTATEKTASQTYGTCKVTITHNGDGANCQITDKYLWAGKKTDSTQMVQSGGFKQLISCSKCGFVKLLGDSDPSVKRSDCGTWQISTSDAI